MNCQEARDLLWDLYEGDLAPAVYREVIAHIASCPECAREARICEEVNRALQVQPVIKAPEGATAAVLSAVRPAARRRRVVAAARRQWWPITAAAAALVFVALGLWGVIPGFKTAQAEPTPLSRALAAGGGYARQFADSMADSAWRTFDLGSVAPLLAGWLWLVAIAVGAFLALVAAEKYLCDRHLAVRIEHRIERR